MTRKGVVTTIEAIVIGMIATAVIISLLAFYANSLTPVSQKVAILDVELCGSVIVIRNNGPDEAIVTKLVYTLENGSVEEVPGYQYLRSGDSWSYNFGVRPEEVTVTGENFSAVVVRNAC